MASQLVVRLGRERGGFCGFGGRVFQGDDVECGQGRVVDQDVQALAHLVEEGGDVLVDGGGPVLDIDDVLVPVLARPWPRSSASRTRRW